MLRELRTLLNYCRPEAQRNEYLAAIRNENCLGKLTAATRKLSGQRLSELYGLDPKIPLFRIMRQCWYLDREGQPILAILLALARDPLLRASAEAVLRMQPGEELARQQMITAIGRVAGHRLSPSTLDKVVRNVASSWTQTGHLRGRCRKVRQKVRPAAGSVAFALLLGYLTGRRGNALFDSPWTKILDTSPGELMAFAWEAHRLGIIDVRQSGGVIEVGFRRLLGSEKR